MKSNVSYLGKHVSKAQRREIREVYKEQLKPILDQAKIDVIQVQNDMINQIVNLPFRKRLRFCYGILLEGRLKAFILRKKGGPLNGSNS